MYSFAAVAKGNGLFTPLIRRPRGFVRLPFGQITGRKATEFQFLSAGDENGVFFYYGSNFGREPWVNPYIAGRLGILISGELGGAFGTRDVLVNRVGNHWHSDAGAIKWFVFDLGISRSCVLSYYSFQSRDDSSNFRTVNWTVAGSNDNITWVDIDTQIGYPFGGSLGAWATVRVAGQDTAYRFFRLLQSGNNSGGDPYLTAGEFEIYGTLIPSVEGV